MATKSSYIFVLIIFLTNTFVCAQSTSTVNAERRAYCDANLPDAFIPELKSEFNALEKYFVQKKLLKDVSGQSYYAVYKKIAQENDLMFKIDTSYVILDTIKFQLIEKCFYKLLTKRQMAQVTKRHLEAANFITKDYQGNISAGKIAQRITNHLTSKDFELEFYRLSSLYTFYNITTSNNSSIFPQLKDDNKNDVKEIITIKLDAKDQILVNSQVKSQGQIESIVYTFLERSPVDKAIKITVSRQSSYETYSKLMDMVNKGYDTLRNDLANKKFDTAYADLPNEKQGEINKTIPKNIIIEEFN